MEPADILIVTPYNAQIRTIQRALAASGQTGFRVGTVDKFQGQEAPAVIYSMATSSADEAPRGLDFLANALCRAWETGGRASTGGSVPHDVRRGG